MSHVRPEIEDKGGQLVFGECEGAEEESRSI